MKHKSIIRDDTRVNYKVINQDILQAPMTAMARGVLCYMLGCSDTFQFHASHLAKMNNICLKTLNNILNELILLGYLIRFQPFILDKESGKSSFDDVKYMVFEKPLSFEKRKTVAQNLYGKAYFKDEIIEKTPEKKVQDPPLKKQPPLSQNLENSPLGKFAHAPKCQLPNTKPIPNRNLLLGNDYMEKSKRGLDRSLDRHSKFKPQMETQRKFPRKPKEEETYQWLLTLDELDTDINTLSYWAHKFPRERLENAYCQFLYKQLNAKFKPRSTGAVFYTILTQETNLIKERALKNKQFAIEFGRKNSWSGVEIKDNYVVDRYNMSRECSFDIPVDEFQGFICKLYQSYNSY